MRKFLTGLRILIILLGVVAIGYGIYYGLSQQYQAYLNRPVDFSDQQRYIFTVEKGETVKSIGQRLKTEKLINNELIFYWYIRSKNVGPQIKAGRFILQKNYSIPKVVAILTEDTPGQTVLTIPEGYTIAQIDQKLAEAELIETGEFTACTRNCNFNDISFLTNAISLEGYLFPDTYFIDAADFKIETLIRRMLNNFQGKITSEMETTLESSEKTLNDYVIMASIIEAEVRTDQDRALVSGILWKRLENDWTLGADATLLYITDDRIINTADLELDSPYNTRKNLGLPPTAIGNPGQKSLEAAFSPSASEYWFYLTTLDTGEVIYAISNEDHNLNKQRYL